MGRVAKEGSTGSPSSGRNLDGARSFTKRIRMGGLEISPLAFRVRKHTKKQRMEGGSRGANKD